MRVCSFTGHRGYTEDKKDDIKTSIRREVQAAVADGFTRFMCGFSDGADLAFAAIVIDEQERNPDIVLEAALPFRDKLNAAGERFQKLIKKCAQVHVTSEEHSSASYQTRNKFLVDSCERLIAIFYGQGRGGAGQTIKYAEKMGRELRIIEV